MADLSLFTHGAQLCNAMYQAIDQARRRVWIETFILGPDAVGQGFINRSVEAAGRGCDVRVIVDHLGSPIAGLGQYKPIQDAGGQVVLYNPLSPWRKFGKRTGALIHRDHRKILIADDIGFCGGHNLSNGYLSDDPSYHDTSVRTTGTLTTGLAEVFEQGHALAAGVGFRYTPSAERGDGILAQDLRRGVKEPEDALAALFAGTTDRCFITLSYFVPPDWLVQSLVESANRGIDVRLLTAGKTDVPIARQAGRSSYETLLGAGVRVFEYQPARMHAKTAVADGLRLLVGSFDYNILSRRHSLEVVVRAEDPSIAVELEETFISNCTDATEIDLNEWAQRGDFERATERLSLRIFECLTYNKRLQG